MSAPTANYSLYAVNVRDGHNSSTIILKRASNFYAKLPTNVQELLELLKIKLINGKMLTPI